MAIPTFAVMSLSFLIVAAIACVEAERVQDFADETNIQLWTCDGSLGQKWQAFNFTFTVPAELYVLYS